MSENSSDQENRLEINLKILNSQIYMCVCVFGCNMNIYAYSILIIAVMNLRGNENGKRSWGQTGKVRNDINVIICV